MDTPGRGLIPHDNLQTGLIAVSAAPVVFDWDNIPAKNVLGVGTNQGSSGTCQTQVVKMAIKRKYPSLDIPVADIYSNIKLPGGGAYYVAPVMFLQQHGLASNLMYPDPNPETEANMSVLLPIQDSDRLQLLQLSFNYVNNPTIDQVAQAILDHDAVGLAIYYTNAGFQKAWMHPSFPVGSPMNEGHALLTNMPQLDSANSSLREISTMTSWYGAMGPDGACTQHIIDWDFFINGGVYGMLIIDMNLLPYEYTTLQGFTEGQIASMDPKLVEALKMNAQGQKNIGLNGKLAFKDPNFS